MEFQADSATFAAKKEATSYRLKAIRFENLDLVS